METRLADWIRDTADGREAEAILRACVHCGFCTATCPTYQLLGDELDGPRGRIYLIKQVLEGREATAKTRLHLDRCLTCRSCETTCPSGVKYHRLLDIGRKVLAEKLPRPGGEELKRRVLAEGLTRPALFGAALALGRLAKPILPAGIGDKIPALGARVDGPAAMPNASRRVLMLAGCVQPGLAPSINVAARRVFAALGIDAVEIPEAGCCGAVRFHLDRQDAARQDIRRLIDRWWPWVEHGSVEAIIVTASGCGAQVKEYGEILADDPAYAVKAAKVSALARDVGDFLDGEAAGIATLLRPASGAPLRVAVHTPCTLQHALKRRGDVERLLAAAGYALTPVAEPHLCCGSAGTYSLLQPEISQRLRDRKLDALLDPEAAHRQHSGQGARGGSPQVIVTANIGCLTHLQSGTETPVRHWIELIADLLADRHAG
jgi:glycolate oxidase iron-sulfur subunit